MFGTSSKELWARVVPGLALALCGCGDAANAQQSPATRVAVSAPVVAPSAAPVAPAPLQPSQPAAIQAGQATSRWPNAARGTFEASELDQLTDGAAKEAARALAESVMANDVARLQPLVGTEMRYRGRRLSGAEANARVTNEGVQAFLGLEPNCFADADGQHCEWSIWHVERGAGRKADLVVVYSNSGYGRTRVVELGRATGSWKIVEVADRDFGEP